MRSSDELFQLVKSLTPAEKRYFKVFSSKHVIGERNNYVHLFDAINRMEQYDEELLKSYLRRKHQGERFIEHLSSEKLRLHRLILQSMRAFRSEKSVSRRLIDMIEDADFLTEKKLYEQAAKVLTKAEALAHAHEDFLILFRIQDLLRSQIQINKTNNVKQQIQDIIAQSDDTASRFVNKLQIQNLYDLVHVVARSNFSERSPAIQSELEGLSKNKLLDSAANALSLTAKLQYHAIHALIGKSRGDVQKAYDHWLESINLLKSNPHRLKEEVRQYIIVSGNFVNTCIHLRQFDKFSELIEDIRELRNLSPESSTELTHSIYHLELMYSLNTANLDRGLALAPQIGDWLQANTLNINRSRLIAIHYNLAILYFVTDNAAQAVQCFDAVTQYGKTDVRRDLQSAARLLLLLLHFDLGNIELIESLCRSANYYLETRKVLFDFEQAILKFARMLLRTDNDTEKSRLLGDTKTTLEELKQRNSKAFTTGLDESLFWIEARLQKCSIREIYVKHVNGLDAG